MNQLESLRRHSTIVADTGEIGEIARFRAQDATTNPSLVLKAIERPEYEELVEEALAFSGRASGDATQRADAFVDKLLVNVGCEILAIVPGRVSTEVPANLSFDVDGSIEKARLLIRLYERAGVARERVLIKLASTWEGVRAAERLEREGIHCNMTLLFSLVQAVACAEARATLISPFVGRIYDWYKKDRGVDDIPVAEDPGVASVESIYVTFKELSYETEIMGASFRKTDQVLALAGCDLLTIGTDLLEELAATDGDVPRRLSPERAARVKIERIDPGERAFRWLQNEDAMATEKLAEGIRRFHADGQKLARYARARVAEAR
jgi:transaldolase